MIASTLGSRHFRNYECDSVSCGKTAGQNQMRHVVQEQDVLATGECAKRSLSVCSCWISWLKNKHLLFYSKYFKQMTSVPV